jgi:hypothetical protein
MLLLLYVGIVSHMQFALIASFALHFMDFRQALIAMPRTMTATG